MTDANKLLVVLLSISIMTTVFLSGCITGELGKATCEFSCKNERDSCNDRCGSGILSSVCREGCTLNYNNCLGQCK